MSFVVKSSNGQRTLTKITTNKDQNRGSLRDELIEALKGLTFKFEVRIADIVQSDDIRSEPAEAQAAEGQDTATFANRRGDILTELKTRLVHEQQQQQQQAQVQTAAAKVPSEPAKDQQQSQQQPRPATVSSLIRPATIKTKPAPTSEPSTFKEAIIDEPKKAQEEAKEVEPVPKSEPRVDVVEPKTNKLPEVAAKPAAKLSPNSGTLVKGSLKIGSSMKTCCIWIDETKQPPVPYISYDSERLAQITSMITNMSMNIESQPTVSSIDVGDIVFAKSKDDNAWYRAIVERVGVEDLDVYLFDWGLTETMDLSRIRRLAVLELGLSRNPAAALKIRVSNPAGALVDKFLECDSMFDIKVDSYDDFDETYAITLLGASADS